MIVFKHLETRYRAVEHIFVILAYIEPLVIAHFSRVLGVEDQFDVCVGHYIEGIRMLREGGLEEISRPSLEAFSCACPEQLGSSSVIEYPLSFDAQVGRENGVGCPCYA